MAAKRRSSCLSSVLALLVPLVLVAAVATAALAQSPAAYWTFNDSSGTRATDSSGNGHTATLVNGVSWAPGEIGGAVSANATSQQYVSIPAIDLSNTKAVTVALWANRNYSRSGGHALFEASNDTNSTTGFGFFPDDATCNGIQATIRGNVGYTANCYDQPSSGVWHHLAVVFDKSQTAGNQVRFYVDGELQIVNWSLHATTNTNNFGNNPIYVFSRAGTTEFDSGTIDDFRIYNSALTTAQVQQIYNSAILLSLAVAPTNPSIAIGTQQQFTAIGTYKDGSRKDLSSSVTWTPSASSVATVSRSGVATARAAGSATIRAALGEINNTVVVTVTLATLVSIAVTPTSASIAAGRQQQFTATGTYTDGSHRNLTSTAVWTSTATSVATISAGGLATGVTAGSTLIKATLGSISGSTGLTVTAATLVSIAVTPANPSITAGQQQQFAATGTYTDGSHQNLTSPATWTSSAPSVASISAGGLATGVAAGSTTITATSGSISGSTGLTVTATTANFTIAASPTSLSVAPGSQGTSTITTTVVGGFNNAITLSASGMPSGTTVSFSPNPIAAPGAGGSTMTVTVGSSTAAGTYPITVTGNGGGIQHTAAVTLTVTSRTISYVQGNYATPQTPQTTVSVTFNGAQAAADLNVVVVGWNDSSATVSSVVDSKRNSYVRAVGPTVVSGALSQSIYYAKNIASAAAGANTVTVSFSTAAVAPDIRILEYRGADLNSPVDVVAANSGNSATSSSGSATTTSAPDLIFGANIVATLTSGPGTGFTSRMLTSPDGDIAEDQMVTTTGSYSASAPLSSAGPWIMQMVAFRTDPPALVSIAVSPTNASIVAAGQQQFTATGTYSDGSHQNLTNTATWTSSATSVATISTAGLATGIAQGSTTIQATSAQISGSATLTVTGPGGFTISASPASVSVRQGNQGSSTITTTISGGFSSSIPLSAAGAPTGTTVSFNPATIAAPGAGNSAITITVGSSTPAGTYPITVTGTGGGIQHSVTVTLTVTAAPNFTLSASPASLSVLHGNQGSSTLTTTISGGFSSSIALSASGAPTGTTVSFNPATIAAPGAGSSTITITVGSRTPTGTYAITVTGNGGGLVRTVTVSLTVTAQVALSWNASTSQGVVGYNAYRSTTSGGGYIKLNSSLIAATSYNDKTVQSGVTYYYVTTAVNSQGRESVYSNQAAATVP